MEGEGNGVRWREVEVEGNRVRWREVEVEGNKVRWRGRGEREVKGR